MISTELIWDFLIENGIATEEELQLVTDVAGYSNTTLESVIYARTAFHDVQQLYDCCKDEFYFSDEVLSELATGEDSEDEEG